MKYIGNKSRLLGFIDHVLEKENIPSTGIFIDMFSGTTSVAQHYKKKGYRIISNDFMTYSYVFQYAYIKNNEYPAFEKVIGHHKESFLLDSFSSKEGPLDAVIQYLNSIPGQEGFIFENYAPEGKLGRQYFSNENAKKIDAVRNQIEEWQKSKLLNEAEYYILLASLIDAADFVANISGTYGAYLKIWRSMALKSFNMLVPKLIESKSEHEIYKEDSNKLIKRIQGDILYLDPPYNSRQYASNFHILETLALWDNPILYGKTGLRPYESQKSNYSKKTLCKEVFEDLIMNAKAKHILLSYNNEGIIPEEFIIKTLNKRGKTKIYKQEYRRFRTERDHLKRHYKVPDDRVTENIYYLKID